MSEDTFYLRIDGRSYDAAELTLNEIEEIEDLCGGVSIEELDLGRARHLKRIVYVLRKRDNPEITLEEAGDVQLKGLVSAEEPVDVTA